MNAFTVSIRTLFLMTILLGGIYPLTITMLGKAFFPTKAGGSLITSGERILGSELIFQEFSKPDYFEGRPSGPSQKSSTSRELKASYQERSLKYGESAPADLLWASGSGLDPHISPEAAKFQIARVAKSRKLTEKEVQSLIDLSTEGRFLGFMGQPRVNVLNLNRLLDKKTSR